MSEQSLSVSERIAVIGTLVAAAFGPACSESYTPTAPTAPTEDVLREASFSMDTTGLRGHPSSPPWKGRVVHTYVAKEDQYQPFVDVLARTEAEFRGFPHYRTWKNDDEVTKLGFNPNIHMDDVRHLEKIALEFENIAKETDLDAMSLKERQNIQQIQQGFSICRNHILHEGMITRGAYDCVVLPLRDLIIALSKGERY